MTKFRLILKRFLLNVWNHSWIFTLPFAVFFIIWISSTISRYIQFEVKYITHGSPSTLIKIGNMELSHNLEIIKQYLSKSKASNNASIKTIDLLVENTRINKLNSSLPYSGLRYTKGKLFYPNGKICQTSLVRGCQERHRTARYGGFRAVPGHQPSLQPK